MPMVPTEGGPAQMIRDAHGLVAVAEDFEFPEVLFVVFFGCSD